MKPVFSGVCTALVTPFLNGSVNYPMLQVLINRQIESGIKTIVLCGTTGESPTLSDQEKLEMVSFAKRTANGRCVIIAGTGSNSTRYTAMLSAAAEKAGADALLIVSPYYNKATSEGLIQHYRTIAASVHIPIILYNVPSRTGLDIPVDVYRALSKEENIAGVKEASSDITKISRIRSLCPETFSIWSGNDAQIVPVMSLGGNGVISVLSNLLPEETIEITDAAMAGNYPLAASKQISLLPWIDLLFSEINPIPIKEAMLQAGYDCGNCRLPLTPASNETAERIRTLLLQEKHRP